MSNTSYYRGHQTIFLLPTPGSSQGQVQRGTQLLCFHTPESLAGLSLSLSPHCSFTITNRNNSMGFARHWLYSILSSGYDHCSVSKNMLSFLLDWSHICSYSWSRNSTELPKEVWHDEKVSPAHHQVSLLCYHQFVQINGPIHTKELQLAVAFPMVTHFPKQLAALNKWLIFLLILIVLLNLSYLLLVAVLPYASLFSIIL